MPGLPGLHTIGLHTIGLHTIGLHTIGLHTIGLNTIGLQIEFNALLIVVKQLLVLILYTGAGAQKLFDEPPKKVFAGVKKCVIIDSVS